MTIDKMDAVLYTVTFIIPGFILFWTYNTFIPRNTKTTTYIILQFLFCTCINYGSCFWLFYLMISTNILKGNNLLLAFCWTFILLINPILLGFIGSFISNKNYIRTLLHKLGMNPVHEIPTAWDYKFHNPNSQYVEVTLTDGSTIHGYFGSKSFSSSDFAERDLYLEKIFHFAEDQSWLPIERTNGIWIKGEHIKFISFYNEE